VVVSSLRTKILLAFFLICLVFAFGSMTIYYQVNIAKDAATQSLMRAKDMENATELESLIGVMYSYQADLIINDSAESIKNYKDKTKIYKDFVEKVAKSADTDQEKKVAVELRKSADEFLVSFDNVANAFNRRNSMSSEQLAGELKRLDGETDIPKEILYKALDFMEESLVEKSKQSSDLQESAMNQVVIASLVIPILVVVLSIIIAFYMARRITRPIQDMAVATQLVANGDLNVKLDVTSNDEIGMLQANFNKMINTLHSLVKETVKVSEQLAASSEELTASAEQSAQAANQVASSIGAVAIGAEKQVHAVNDTSAVVEQMSAGIQQVATNTNLVAEKSSKAAETAKIGGTSVDKAVNQMAKIEQTVNNSAQVVTTLGARSKEIGQIVNTISGIAGQTNLLALNAAIEAARAGEQGRGFAVVAEEVRKLAEQSQDAAKKIATLISEIQGDTDKAVVAMSEGTREVKIGTEVVTTAGYAFREIEVLVTEVSNQVQEISAAVQQMASGSQHIVSSVKEIDELSKNASSEAQTVSATTEEQSASMEEIASSSQSLAKMAQDLQEVVSKFRV